MTVDREEMYRYPRPAAYAASRGGPIRGRFAAMALACAVVMAALVLAAGAVFGGGF
jgi:hypothetical protein